MTVSVLRVYDPAMCCSSGVCGPSVDPELPRFAADLAWLAEQGVRIERYNLSQEPAAFAQSAIVKARLTERGTDALPLILAEDRIAAEGGYPTREVLAAIAGITVSPLGARLKPEVAGGSGCTPNTGCCG
jgi:hypothetical protein